LPIFFMTSLCPCFGMVYKKEAFQLFIPVALSVCIWILIIRCFPTAFYFVCYKSSAQIQGFNMIESILRCPMSSTTQWLRIIHLCVWYWYKSNIYFRLSV
jgi:hypothetical protein